MAQIQAKDLFEVKVDILRVMAGLDLSGDWIGWDGGREHWKIRVPPQRRNVSRQDPLLKLNHANVMEVPGSCEIRVVPKAPYDFIIKNGKLAMDIPCGQKFIRHKGV
ncbi:hypothetical protein JHK87_012267 [Glycine soja]|nr:hypothetical protein JHK87_012267 [Glycine soja]